MLRSQNRSTVNGCRLVGGQRPRDSELKQCRVSYSLITYLLKLQRPLKHEEGAIPASWNVKYWDKLRDKILHRWWYVAVETFMHRGIVTFNITLEVIRSLG